MNTLYLLSFRTWLWMSSMLIIVIGYSQPEQPLEDLYNDAARYATARLNQGEELTLLQCVIVSRSSADGIDKNVSLIRFDKGNTYTLRLESNRNIQQMYVYVFDQDTEDSITSGWVENGRVTLTVQGNDFTGIVAMGIGEYDDEHTFDGSYSLVATSKKESSQNVPSRRPSLAPPTLENGGLTQIKGGANDCDFDRVRKMPFRTSSRTEKNILTGEEKTSSFVASFKINMRKNLISQKRKGSGSINFTILETSCLSANQYVFQVMDPLRNTYTFILDTQFDTGSLTVQLEASNTETIYKISR